MDVPHVTKAFWHLAYSACPLPLYHWLIGRIHNASAPTTAGVTLPQHYLKLISAIPGRSNNFSKQPRTISLKSGTAGTLRNYGCSLQRVSLLNITFIRTVDCDSTAIPKMKLGESETFLRCLVFKPCEHQFIVIIVIWRVTAWAVTYPGKYHWIRLDLFSLGEQSMH